MELKRQPPKLWRGNAPLEDKKGFAQGLLIDVVGDQYSFEQKDRLGEIDVVQVDQCVFTFEVEGTGGTPFRIVHKTSTKLAGQKYILKGKGRGSKEIKDYNKLTKTCLQLNLVTESELQVLDDKILQRVMDDLTKIKNLPIKFKPILDPKTRFFNVGLNSLQVLPKEDKK